MSNSFEWQTEEADWLESEPIPAQHSVPPSPTRRWRLLLLIVALATGVAFVVQWQIKQRVSTATSMIADDVLSAHNFLLATAFRKDQELLKPLLSIRDKQWTAAQNKLINLGLFMPRPHSFWKPEKTTPLSMDAVEIAFDETFLEAELRFHQEFAVLSPAGITETVTLELTAVYRKGNNRWLYSPPLDEFWQGWESFSGEYLNLIMPGRDAALGEQLGNDLDDLLAEMCALPQMQCPQDLQVQLRFETDPQTVIDAAEISGLQEAGRRLELPTPTLVGVPVDQGGYDFLLRAYGEQLVRVIMPEVIGVECCRWQRVQDALRDWQLAQLELISWPMDTAQYEQLFLDNPPLQQPGIFGGGRDYDPNARDSRYYQVRALVEFIISTAAPQTSAGDWQRRFVELDSVSAWMGDLVLSEYQNEAFIPAFLQYVYQRSRAEQMAAPPIPYPESKVNMICNGTHAITLHHYDWQTASWSTVHRRDKAEDGYAYFQPIYDQYRVATERLIINQNFDEGSGQPREGLLIEEGEVTQRIPFIPGAVFYGLGDPTGRYIVQASFEPEGSQPLYVVSDLQNCGPTGCAYEPLDGWPIWSPDGRFLLADGRDKFWREGPRSFDEIALWRQPIVLAAGNGSDRQQIGQGAFPTWLDVDQFVYTAVDNQDYLQLVTAALGSMTGKVLLSGSELVELIPAEFGVDSLKFLRVDSTLLFSAPDREPLIFIMAYDNHFGVTGMQTHYFQVRLSEDKDRVLDISYLFNAGENSVLNVSAHGRWLALATFDNSFEITMTIIDQENGKMEVLNYPHQRLWGTFSPDGNWLSLVDDTKLTLIALGEDFQEVLFPPGTNCDQVFWGW